MICKFAHSSKLHFIAAAFIITMAYLAYGCCTTEFFRGGPAARWCFAGFCALFALAILLLYMFEGINRYEVTDSGLRIRRAFKTSFHPWSEIVSVYWNPAFHLVVIRAHRMLIFMSTDFFPRVDEFLRLIHERSQCALSPSLANALRPVQ